MRQQFLDPTGRLRGQPLQHVLEVGVRIVAIDVGRVHQAHDGCGPLPPQAGRSVELYSPTNTSNAS